MLYSSLSYLSQTLTAHFQMELSPSGWRAFWNLQIYLVHIYYSQFHERSSLSYSTDKLKHIFHEHPRCLGYAWHIWRKDTSQASVTLWVYNTIKGANESSLIGSVGHISKISSIMQSSILLWYM